MIGQMFSARRRDVGATFPQIIYPT